ncbi:RdgB/HAM1 family non-canonical purine NTP pyrophosphatase [Enterococcus sp. 4G2_DIV0659]|uniref:RdgB/HAM1 family non-canonical purine NTP pyrophosphatase n=2 Tax=Candidatus Enterococcus mansonii TaxID=1834181 RepID=A0A242CI02_9ENTE|nr:RdgB/HAM1 family non-canonical purine NTP pyrophosphatase [Enterococcus sp. 4G2_DIV0659]
MEIIVGTNNQGKLREIQSAYSKEQITFVPYTKYTKSNEEVAEIGNTYTENALIKAQFYAQKIGKPVLADDGGLEIDAFPTILGVQTARFFKTGMSDTEKNQQLLALFDAHETFSRTIHLHAVLVYAWPNGEYIISAKQLNGELAKIETGELGYGFDKIFYLPKERKTLAQLSDVQRNELSPRMSALKELIEKLKE